VQFISKFLAAICAVLFVISSVLVLLLFNIERKAFSAATYKQAFENQGLYQRMPQILGGTLTTYIAEKGNAFPFLQVLTEQDWQNSIALLLPPDELKQIANQALDATFDYLNGKTSSATLSLSPVKAHLAGDSGVQLILQILQQQPACTPEQLSQMALGLFGGQIVLCNPPQEAMGLMMPFIQTELQAIVAIFPDQVTFIPGTASGTPNDPRLKLNAVRSAIKLTPFFPVLLLFGIAVFAVRRFADWLTWWGWPLMIAGGVSILMGLFGAPLVGGILRIVIQNLGLFLIPPALAASIAETASAVAHQMLTPVVVEGFILGFIGLAMVIVATFLTTREKSDIATRIPG
jgi:hypothetical protein